MRRVPVLLFFMLLFLLSGPEALAQGRRDKAAVDSLWDNAAYLGRHGRFEESNVIFQGILDQYKLSRRERRSAYYWLKRNAQLSGDYQACCDYAEKADESFDVLYLSLASLPVQSVERPDHDISVPYQVDSVFKEGKYRGGFIRIPVDFDGSREWMILDNGAAKFSGVTESFAAAHGIRPTGATGKGRGSTGELSSYWIGIADSLSVGDLLVRNLLFSVFPDGSMENPYMSLDAILGSNFCRLAGEMRIDNRNRMVTFPGKYEDRASNLTLNGGDQHFVDVAVLGDTLRMQLDLGCISTDLNYNYYKRNKKAVRSTYEAKTSTVFGVGGSRQVITFRVKELPLKACGGRFVKEDADIFTVQLRDDPGVYGMLGSDFVLHFDTVILNLDRMYLYVTPSQDAPN